MTSVSAKLGKKIGGLNPPIFPEIKSVISSLN